MSQPLTNTILKVIGALFVLNVILLSDRMFSAGFPGLLHGLLVGLQLTLTIAAPGIIAGAFLYWLYKHCIRSIGSGILQNFIWWIAVLGGGVCGVLIGIQIANLYVLHDGQAGMGVLISHTIIPGALGLAFGAGWGQGEKLM